MSDIETITTPDGRKRVVMDQSDYQDLLDARDHAVAMRGIAAGDPTFTEAEMDAYLAAPSPLAFWRQRAGLTQQALADKVGITQPFLAQMEGGKRQGSVAVLSAMAKALAVHIEDLLPE